MNGFRSMGCDVLLSDGGPLHDVHALFEARDRRFSRFHDSSELNRVNAFPRGLTLVSEEFASMLSLALDAARATGGLVTPAAGGALIAAGYDRDYRRLLSMVSRSSRRAFPSTNRSPCAGAPCFARSP